LYDVDPELMTFVTDRDLDVLKIYPRNKNKVSRSGHSQVKARAGRTHKTGTT